MLIPIGHDQSIRRLPWVTIAIMIACVLVQLHRTFFAPWDREVEQAAEASQAADFALVHRIERARATNVVGVGAAGEEAEAPSTSTLDAWLPGASTMSDEQIVKAVHEGRSGSDDDPYVAASRRSWNALQSLLDRDLARRMAYVPTSPFSVFMILCAFAHAGWLHLAGNMIFLWLCGCNLEDRWGAPVFGAFYLASAWVASFAFYLAHRGQPIPCVGASGAIAGAMGAFVVAFGRARIQWLWIWWMRVRKFHTPAYVALPMWFGAQLLQLVLEVHAGASVAYSAHVGGFLFGVGVAVAMRASGVEKKIEERREAKEVGWSEHPDYLRALDLAEKDPAEASRLLARVVADRPEHVDARVEICRLAMARADASALAASFSPAIAALGRAQRSIEALELAESASKSKLDPPLDELAAWTLVRAAHESNQPQICVRAAKRLQIVAPASGHLPKTFLYVATAQQRVGRADLAAQTLRRLIEQHPTHACADEARKLLAAST